MGRETKEGNQAEIDEARIQRVKNALNRCAHIVPRCSKCPYEEQKRRNLVWMGGPCTSFLHNDALTVIESLMSEQAEK